MSFIYDKLFEKLKERGISTYQLRQNGLSPTIINKLVHGQNVNTSTLEYFCKLLSCDIGDIMEYVPDGNNNRTLQEMSTSIPPLSQCSQKANDIKLSNLSRKVKPLSEYTEDHK